MIKHFRKIMYIFNFTELYDILYLKNRQVPTIIYAYNRLGAYLQKLPNIINVINFSNKV